MTALAADGGASGGSTSLAAERVHSWRPVGREHAAADEQAHQEDADQDHDPGHEQEDQLLPAQLNFAKGVFLGRCHQMKN